MHDDDELRALMRSIDPATTPEGDRLTVDELAGMRSIMAARPAKTPRRPRRRWIVAGATAVVLAVGGGALGNGAVAEWMLPHVLDPRWDNAEFMHSFTLPSGRGCQIRVMVVDKDGGPDLTAHGIEFSEWLAANDLWPMLDWDAARAEDDRMVRLHGDESTMVLEQNGRLADAPVFPAARTPDDVEASIVAIAVNAAVDHAIEAQGRAYPDVVAWRALRCDVAAGN